jgi:hypothetical protein
MPVANRPEFWPVTPSCAKIWGNSQGEAWPHQTEAYRRRIIVDRVRPCRLLEEHNKGRDDAPVSRGPGFGHEPQLLPDGRLCTALKVTPHLEHGLLDHVRVHGLARYEGHGLLRPLAVAVLGKPARRLGLQKDAEKKEDSWDHLHGEWHPPLGFGWLHVLARTVIDPDYVQRLRRRQRGRLKWKTHRQA